MRGAADAQARQSGDTPEAGALPRSGPVSVVFAFRVPLENAAAFEAAQHATLAAVSRQPGYVSHDVLRGPPGQGGRDYHVVFRFADEPSWKAWYDSRERHTAIQPLYRLSERQVHRKWTGLEAWFDLPDTLPPPSRHRMTLLTWCAIWPLVTLVFWVLGPVLMPLALPVRTLVVTAIVVPTMTYVLMPHLTRWFAPWLTVSRRDAG